MLPVKSREAFVPSTFFVPFGHIHGTRARAYRYTWRHTAICPSCRSLRRQISRYIADMDTLQIWANIAKIIAITLPRPNSTDPRIHSYDGSATHRRNLFKRPCFVIEFLRFPALAADYLIPRRIRSNLRSVLLDSRHFRAEVASISRVGTISGAARVATPRFFGRCFHAYL